MRIAQINLPTVTNAGAPALAAHAYLEDRLTEYFGGFTSWIGAGVWKDNGKLYSEQVKVYQVAYDAQSIAARHGAIVVTAHEAARRAEQIAVFYIIDGEAFVDTLPKV